MFQVVEDQEKPPPTHGLPQPLDKRLAAGIADAEGVGDRGHDQGRVLHRAERGKGDLAGIPRPRIPRQLKGYPGLANAARAGEGDESCSRVEKQSAQLPEFTLPPDKVGQWSRQRGGRLRDRRRGATAGA